MDEPVPLVFKFSAQIVLNVFVVGQSQVQIQLRHYDIEWVANTNNGFVDINGTRSPELDGEMRLHEPSLLVFVVTFAFETQSSKCKIHYDLVAVGCSSGNTCDGFQILAEEGGS